MVRVSGEEAGGVDPSGASQEMAKEVTREWPFGTMTPASSDWCPPRR